MDKNNQIHHHLNILKSTNYDRRYLINSKSIYLSKIIELLKTNKNQIPYELVKLESNINNLPLSNVFNNSLKNIKNEDLALTYFEKAIKIIESITLKNN